MNLRLLPLLVLSLCVHATTFAGELPDYIRFTEDAKVSRLEVATRTFTMPSGRTVDLIGVVHIADDVYYQELNKRFAGYDSVLFELVGDPKKLTESGPLTAAQRTNQSASSAIGAIQLAAAKYLNLTFQLGAVDYTGKNMVHADASWEEFGKMQQQRGETVMTLFARAMQAQVNGGMSRAALDELDTFALIRILMSPDSAAEFKTALAKVFDQMESMSAAMEGNNPSAILGGRNDLVLEKVKAVLAKKTQRHIAVFYGCAHMPGIESALIREMDARATGEEWLVAWMMPKRSAVVRARQP
jgi:hypothetical protein